MATTFDPASAFGSGGLAIQHTGGNGLTGTTSAPISAIGTPYNNPADPDGYYAKILADSRAQTANLLSKYQNVVAAPKLDYSAISAQARASAEQNVNPYYTKTLNDFLSGQAVKRAQSQKQTETDIQTLQDALTNTLQGNEIAKGRTSEDVATNQAQINQTADQFQTDSGQKFTADRLALAKASSGGGLGAQTIENATLGRNTAEKRQEQQFQQSREQQELSKVRTFEDLARSGELATTSKEKGVAQKNIDLANFIQNQDIETADKRNQLELERQARIGQEQSAQGKILVNNFLQSISNPAVNQAARQAYGNLF